MVLVQELNVVQESLVHVYPFGTSGDKFVAHIEFIPTVPHCSLATLIGQPVQYAKKASCKIRRGLK
jgi:hypothetical protein